MTMSTSSSAMTSAWITSLIEPLTNTVSSMLMPILMSGGRRRLHQLHLGVDALGDLQHVRRRLRNDAEAERRLAVGARDVAQVLGRELDVRDFAEAHQVAAFAAADDQLAEIARRVQAGVRVQREFALAGFDAAGGQLDVLGAQRILDVLHGEPARRHRLAVEPDAHREAALAADADLRDALDDGEAIDEVALRVVGQLQLRAAVALQVQPHDRVGSRVDLRRPPADRPPPAGC